MFAFLGQIISAAHYAMFFNSIIPIPQCGSLKTVSLCVTVLAMFLLQTSMISPSSTQGDFQTLYVTELYTVVIRELGFLGYTNIHYAYSESYHNDNCKD